MFQKYPSIENSYRDKFINLCLKSHPELLDIDYCIHEKIDGANIQIILETNQEIKFGKRSSLIPFDDSFFNLKSTVESTIIDFVNELNKEVQQSPSPIKYTLYGEIFGKGIQKRINYGETKQIRFFDLAVNNIIVDQFVFDCFMSGFGASSLKVPLITHIRGLNEALSYSCDFDSKILNIENNPAEGIVIKPFDKVYYTDLGSIFYLKKKSDAFQEKMKTKTSNPISEEERFFRLKFLEYITENRLLSVFSKEGLIKDKSEIGKYMKLFLEDAKEDFLKENTLPENIDLKFILKSSSQKAFQFLDKHL